MSLPRERMNIFPKHILIIPLVFFALIASHCPAFAALLKVSPGQGTISSAVDGAASGDMLLLEDGSYIDNVTINKFISVIGKNGRDNVSIEAADPARPVISVSGVKGSLSDKSRNVLLTGLTIKGSTVNALTVVGSSGVSILTNRLFDNETALYVERSEGLLIKGNIITDNIKGIYLRHSNANLIEKNNVDRNFNNGMLLLSSHFNELRENTALENYWNGITIGASNNNLIVDNRAVKNTYAIVVTEGTGNILIGNSTMRRIYLILPIVLVYLAIMIYLIERKTFIAYYNHKYKERGRVQGTR